MIVSPERVSRSQRGAAAVTGPARPASSPVKSHCIWTPWLPVTIIAAYAEPEVAEALIMIPALDHGCRPAFRSWTDTPSGEYEPVSDVTRTVTLLSRPTGLCTK